MARLDEDLELVVQGATRRPLGAALFALVGAGLIVGVDFVYDRNPTQLAYLAVLSIVTATAPWLLFLPFFRRWWRVWAEGQQLARHEPEPAPQEPPTSPPAARVQQLPERERVRLAGGHR